MPSGCRDSSIFFEPDGVTGSPWNDFAYFYGEKDFVWARQYIAENAADYHIDNDRIVATGLSTGAHYSSFLAHAAVPWTTSTAFSTQALQPTEIAGVASFETVSWLKGFEPQAGTLMPVEGTHWSKSATEPFVAAAWASDVTATQPDLLGAGSTSRWVRLNNRRVPMFLASGDGGIMGAPSADFGRNANVFPTDYDRDTACPSLSECDPLLTHPLLPGPLFFHDIWHSLILKQDLLASDEAFHREYSQLFLRNDLTWSLFPLTLTTSGSTPDPVADPEFYNDIDLVDGTYSSECGGNFPNPGECGSIFNASLQVAAGDWADKAVSVAQYNTTSTVAPIPEVVLSATGGHAGETVTLSVDLNAHSDSRYDHVAFMAYLSSADVVLTFNQEPLRFLVDISHPDGELISIVTGATSLLNESAFPSRVVELEVPLAHDLVAGTPIYFQACLYDLSVVGTKAPLTTTNAVQLDVLPRRSILPGCQRVWINEIHYDNVGADIDEGVELAGLDGTYMFGLSLHSYRAATGLVEVSVDVPPLMAGPVVPILDDQGGELGLKFGTFFQPISLLNAPGGIALARKIGVDMMGEDILEVLEFVSYEGTFVALDGPAAGMTSTDIGVVESSATPIGNSLQRQGTGLRYDAFDWNPAGSIPNTYDLPNTGQLFEVGP